MKERWELQAFEYEYLSSEISDEIRLEYDCDPRINIIATSEPYNTLDSLILIIQKAISVNLFQTHCDSRAYRDDVLDKVDFISLSDPY